MNPNGIPSGNSQFSRLRIMLSFSGSKSSGGVGIASCQRISSIIENPTSRNRNEVIRYWIPMTL